MNFHDPLPARERIVLGLISGAAAAGKPCPTNERLSEAVGCMGAKAGSSLVAKLEKRGLITVQRTRKSRVVTVLATGAATARPHGGDHAVVAQRRSDLAELVAEGASVVAAGLTLGMSRTRAHQVFAEIASETDLLHDRGWTGWSDFAPRRQHVDCN